MSFVNGENPGRKPRADAKLRTLPGERQAGIMEFLRTGSLTECRAWLAADGIAVSETAISQFRKAWTLEQRFNRAGAVAEDWQNNARANADALGLTESEIVEIGNKIFLLEAQEERDPKLWFKVLESLADKERLRQGRDKIEQGERKMAALQAKLELEERKIVLLEAKAAKADAAAAALEEKKRMAGNEGLSADALAVIETTLGMLR